jgi:hypothetical protein
MTRHNFIQPRVLPILRNRHRFVCYFARVSSPPPACPTGKLWYIRWAALRSSTRRIWSEVELS